MKILNRLLCFTLIFAFLCLPLTAMAEEYDYTREIEFLTKIGVSGVNARNASEAVTRAEAALYIAEAMNYEKDGASQVFLDVKASHKAFGAVWYLKTIGAISANDNQTFRPDDKITYNELMKIVAVILGYEPYAQVKGGYPSGYSDAARKAGVVKKINNDGVVTKGELYSVVYNMLFANVMDSSSVSYDKKGEPSVKLEKGKMLIENAYKLTEKSGQIRATYYASIYGDTATAEDYVKIDNFNYRTVADASFSDLGAYVDYYLTEDDVVFMIAKRDITEYSIKSEDIKPTTTTSEIKYSVNDKDKSLKIADDAFYMYNSRPLTALTSSQLRPSYGKLELIDNDRDNIIDVVKIWDYKSYYIKNISNDRIFVSENAENKSHFQYKTDDKTVIVLNKKMEEVGVKLLKVGKIVTVAESDESIVFILSDDIFEGTLQSINSDGEAIIDGLKYNHLESAKLKDALGKKLKFYLDANETIVYTSDTEELDYAVLFGVSKSGVFDADTQVKLYDKGYFDIYDCTSKIQLSLDGGVSFEGIPCEELYDKLYNTTEGKIEKQLVKFGVKDGKLNKLIIANNEKDACTDEFRCNLNYGKDVKWEIGTRQQLQQSENGKINYMYSNSGTYVYLVSDDEDECIYDTMDAMYGGHYAVYKDNAQSYYDLRGYDMSEVGVLKYILIDLDTNEKMGQASSSTTQITADTPLALVIGKSTILDSDGDPIEVINAYTNSTGLRDTPTLTDMYPIRSDLTNNTRKWDELITRYPKDSIKFSDLEAGDIIQYIADSTTGRIKEFIVLNRGEDIKLDICTNTGGFEGRAWDTVLSGYVTYKDKYGVRVENDVITHSVYGNSVPVMFDAESVTNDFTKVYRYNSDTGNFELTVANDIYEGARVWCYIRDKYFQYGVIFVIVE